MECGTEDVYFQKGARRNSIVGCDDSLSGVFCVTTNTLLPAMSAAFIAGESSIRNRISVLFEPELDAVLRKHVLVSDALVHAEDGFIHVWTVNGLAEPGLVSCGVKLVRHAGHISGPVGAIPTPSRPNIVERDYSTQVFA